MSSNTTVILKKSGISGNTPSDLAYGEVALNYAEGKLFYKNGVGIKYITNQQTFSTINANSTLILAGSYTDTVDIVAGSGISIVGDAINKKITISSTGGGGGGSSTLYGLTDVDIQDPLQTNDILTYSGATGKWYNRQPAGGYTHSTLTFFPVYDYSYGENNQNHENYPGQLGPTVDSFGVSLSTNFDCMDPVGSLQIDDLGILA
jgi:hypothetical protein